MHLNRRGTLGITIPVLLGSALAAGVALPASATTWHDTGLVASQFQSGAFGGSGLGAADGTNVIKLSGSGVTWSLHGTATTGVSLSGTTISYSGSAVTSPPAVVVDAKDGAGNVEALEIPVAITASAIKVNGTVVTVALSGLAAANTNGTITFSATSSKSSSTISFAESSLPSGLASGSPVLTYAGGTAAPGSYGGVGVTATDTDGATLSGTFTLVVYANSNYGDEVNPFGNGFDVYRQQQHAGAIIAGWTATQADPATHFILNGGTHAGAYQFEYAPNGTAAGLCVSDPAGGWSSDPLRDGLILVSCNTGPWQQFLPQPNGTLKNLATGLYINPNGTGSQLRGGLTPTTWGGSGYTWTDETQLPK
jgi:hypothetical protein